MRTDLKSRKKAVKLSVFFGGSAHTKAAHIMLMKLTPGFVIKYNECSGGVAEDEDDTPLCM